MGVAPSQRLEHNFPSVYFDSVRTAASRDANRSDVLVLAFFTNGHPCAPAKFQRIGVVYDLSTVRQRLRAQQFPKNLASYSEALEILQKGYGRKSALRTRIISPQDSGDVEIVKLML